MELRNHPAIQGKGKLDGWRADWRQLKIDPSNDIRDLTTPENRAHIEALKGNIRSFGVKDPLEIRFDGADIYVTDGRCRLTALAELRAEGWDEVLTVVTLPERRGQDDAERTLGYMITSSLKKNYDRIEMAEGVRRLDGFGWSPEKIAQRMGWTTTATVDKYFEIAGLPVKVKEHINQKEISADTALKVVKEARDAKKDDAFAAELIAANLAENKRLGVGVRGGKVTPKTLKRDAKPKAKPEAPALPGLSEEEKRARAQALADAKERETANETDRTVFEEQVPNTAAVPADLPAGLPAPQNNIAITPTIISLRDEATQFIVLAASMDLRALAQTHLNFASETPVEAPNWEETELRRIRAVRVIDAIGSLKFPNEWASARDGACITHDEVRTGEESQDGPQDGPQDEASEAA